mgnify:CR=1 FL=1
MPTPQNNPVPTPRAIDRNGNAALAAIVRALANMQVEVTTPGGLVTSLPQVRDGRALLRLDVSGLTVEGFAPGNIDVLNLLGDDGGVLTYNGFPVATSEDIQVDDSWASSMVFDCADSRIHNITLAGSTTFAITNLAAGRSVRLLLWPGASARTLTWPSGWNWTNGKPDTIAATKPMVVRIYVSGASADSVIANYEGGY